MTAAVEKWDPVRHDQLQVGHYIKINHRWFDHPFVRKVFVISSEDEIAIIRNAGLTRLFVDYARSTQPQKTEIPQRVQDEEQQVAVVAAQLKDDKAVHCAKVAERQAQLAEVRGRYRTTVERAHALLGMLNATDPTCVAVVNEQVNGVVELLCGDAAPLALAATAAPLNTQQRNALLGSDAMSLVGVIGKRVGLPEDQLRTLAIAASMHMVGLQRVPPHLADEKADGSNAMSPAFRQYPIISAQIVEGCGGFSAEVLRIVREHRERPDGSGFPRGLAAKDIHPFALILGMVREFQVQCCMEKTSPSIALAYMYKNMREIFGETLINHLVASLTVYPPGAFVLLSDGSIARVLRVNAESRMRPVVGLIDEESSVSDAEILDLSQEKDLTVARFVDQTVLPRHLIDQDQSWVGVVVAPPSANAA